jgi:hypothetical protein
MAKWLIAIATTVALVAPAAAGSRNVVLPDKMLGDWCYDDDHEVYTRNVCSSDHMITLKRDEFYGDSGYDNDTCNPPSSNPTEKNPGYVALSSPR